jgi:protein-S-isoprenylcysteine O-methyltransferase Ste14
MSLTIRAFGGLFFTLAVMAAALFLVAGTLDYWQAWTFLAVFGGSGLAITAYLMTYDRALLERRVRGGPTRRERAQPEDHHVGITSTSFVGVLILSAFDHRAHWSAMAPLIAIGGDLLIIFGWTIIFFVFRANPFTSATIELAANQKVISTGPYAVVRHPMYGGALFYLIGIPIALGSWWGIAVIALILPALIWRLVDEERFLAKNLPGYTEYRDRTKYRLAPFIW